MKHILKISRHIMPMVLTLILSLAATAQGPVYHPGQTIRISITFDGPDAKKIDRVAMSLSSAASPSQPGFRTEIYSEDSKKTSPATFEVSYAIPDIQGSGDYQLNQIRVFASVETGGPQITLYYNSPTEFPARTFKIDNSNTLIKPTIKDVKELP
jgi:hypothetical protein